MRILYIENYDHCCFCNYDSTHFSILRVSANALYDCYSRIVDSFIFIHWWSRLVDVEFLFSCSTRREILYLRALMHYSLCIIEITISPLMTSGEGQLQKEREKIGTLGLISSGGYCALNRSNNFYWPKKQIFLWSVINREMKINTYNRHLLQLGYVIIIIVIAQRMLFYWKVLRIRMKIVLKMLFFLLDIFDLLQF